MVKLKRKLFLARKNWRTLALVFAGAFLGVGLIAGGISLVSHLVSAAPTVPVPSVSLTSQHASYASNTPGAWNIEKSAKWTSTNTARITFEVDTVAKIAENVNYDIIFVTDISGSMGGNKLAQVKADASELAESLLSDNRNRIALVSFDSEAQIESGFTSDKNLMLQKINALSDTGATNYYDGLVKAEEVLEGYTQQPNRELILLFLTDGFPNVDTPNEIGQYELLKQKYPYMIINGIQYEMGAEVLDPIKAVSDYQYIATMTDLNNVLFEASVAPYTYDEYILTDFINDEYFDLGSISNISTDKGTFSLDYDGNTPKVTWNLSGLRSGNKAKMTINITLKDGQYAEDRLYPTNKSTTVKTTLTDTPSENIVTDNTPVLKNDYDVIYDPNTPSGCAVSGMPATLVESHHVFETVALTDAEPTCTGYNFTGFDASDTDVKWLNDDYFVMPSSDVILRATWTKISMEKSMDGTVHETKTATFDDGYDLSIKIKRLAGQSSADIDTTNTNITAFKRADLLSESVDINNSAYILSKSDSQAPIYGWFDDNDGTIYYYTDAENVAAYNFRYLFRRMESLTDISGLANIDTASVTSFHHLFASARSLSDISALSNWDTSSVTDMSYMFEETAITDISALSGWDTSQVTDMRYMFNNTAITSVSALSGWDTSQVTNMSHMFDGTAITSVSALSGWDTSQVRNMSGMFRYTSSLSDISALSGWDTSQVTNMSGIFLGTAITSASALANWDTSKVKDMSSVFAETSSLTNISVLANWDTSEVTEMGGMFRNASSLSNISALSGWDTSKVTNMNSTFQGTAITSVSGLSNWDTSSVTNMNSIFHGALSLSDISALANWNTSSVTSMNWMFYEDSSLTDISALANWNTSSVTGMSGMFYKASSLTNISALANWDISSVTTISSMFDRTAVTSASALSGWDTSSVTNMGSLFYNVSSLTNISALANWDTSSVTSMSSVFLGTSITDISALSGWDTSSVTNMMQLFRSTNITSVSALFNWDTSSVTNMGHMFYYSHITSTAGLAGWDVSKVTLMDEMFEGARYLTDISALSNWNTSSVTNMGEMFRDADSLTDISALSNWNTSNVTDMNKMFYKDSRITSLTPLNNWNTSSLTNKTDMFYGIPDSVTRPSWY